MDAKKIVKAVIIFICVPTAILIAYASYKYIKKKIDQKKTGK